VTSETYVIDSTGLIRYHGSIDDSQNVARVTTRRLALALDAVWRDVVVVLPPSTGRMPAMKTFRTSCQMDGLLMTQLVCVTMLVAPLPIIGLFPFFCLGPIVILLVMLFQILVPSLILAVIPLVGLLDMVRVVLSIQDSYRCEQTPT
jgi:hypothetical protein